jgi:predicted neuraminidase
MAAEVKKEIQLEIAHVLFIDIVGYSKLSINDQRAAIDDLTQAVRASAQFQNAEAGARLIKIPTGDGMALVFTRARKSQWNVRSKSVALSKNTDNFEWECTAARSAA